MTLGYFGPPIFITGTSPVTTFPWPVALAAWKS